MLVALRASRVATGAAERPPESSRYCCADPKPLYQAIVETLREQGLAGATVLRGIEGFGARSRLHTHRILRLSEELPIVIEVADQANRIDAVLPTLDAMVTEGLLTVEAIHIIAYRSGNADDAGSES